MGEIWDLIESVSECFSSYSYLHCDIWQRCYSQKIFQQEIFQQIYFLDNLRSSKPKSLHYFHESTVHLQNATGNKAGVTVIFAFSMMKKNILDLYVFVHVLIEQINSVLLVRSIS